MYRTHNCGELRVSHLENKVTLCGWLKTSRDFGGLTFIDLRDRFGITQLVFNMDTNATLCENARALGREYVLQVSGTVVERSNKNPKIPTGNVEVIVTELRILNASKTPPFTIDDDTDGGEDLRMKFRYLDLRRNVVRSKLQLRHKMALELRNYLSTQNFIEVETPYLIKSTPEGARDFVVPSRMNQGEFYALPQSPQTFKQLLMVSGFDRYFQIVKCFRDEDLRADRQPEFTQLDCEMSFVTQDDVLQTFEGLCRHLFSEILDVTLEDFPTMTYDQAMKEYGSDKPDIRFGMKFIELDDVAKGKGFQVFDNSEWVGGINVEGCADYTRKQLDQLIDWVKRPQIGATGMIWCKFNEDGSFKSSVDKFFSEEQLQKWAEAGNSKPGDLILVLAGKKDQTRKALNELRLEMGERLGLRSNDVFCPLWVVDFPLVEWDEDGQRWHAMHHPFTSPKPEDFEMMKTNPGAIRANAYDLVINGVELGGGSIRIHDRSVQESMFDLLGFTKEEAEKQFGFLLNAFQYGAPPHGGIAFGFDRWAAMFGASETIRDFIAFPKNNAGRDVMIDAPSTIDNVQLDELGLNLKK